MTVRHILTFALLTWLQVGSAQIYFNEQIDWNKHYEYLSKIVEYSDFHKFVIAGGSLIVNPQKTEIIITQIDSTGKVFWQKSFSPQGALQAGTDDMASLDSVHALLLATVEFPPAVGGVTPL
jgi:hypothetical protein